MARFIRLGLTETYLMFCNQTAARELADSGDCRHLEKVSETANVVI